VSANEQVRDEGFLARWGDALASTGDSCAAEPCMACCAEWRRRHRGVGIDRSCEPPSKGLIMAHRWSIASDESSCPLLLPKSVR